MHIARSLVEEMKLLGDFPSNVNQAKAQGFVPHYEHIGEGEAINPDGSCTHTLLYPNADQTMCILPERVDIGKVISQLPSNLSMGFVLLALSADAMTPNHNTPR